MVRHPEGPALNSNPPLLSTPPFASCVPFRAWEPKGREAGPTFRVLELELLSALPQLKRSSAATTSHKLEPDISSLLQELACQSNVDTYAALRELCPGLIDSLLSCLSLHMYLVFGTWGYATRQPGPD